MASEDSRDGGKHDLDPDIAAADWLLQDDSAVKPASPGVSPDPKSDFGSSDTFAVIAPPSADGIPTVAPTTTPPPATDWNSQHAKPRKAVAKDSEDRMRLEPSALVEQTWSRWAEWGPNILAVGAWLMVVFGIVYALMDFEQYGLAFLVLLLGGLAAVILAYPILITLERPVRVTPEQAVRDYFGALSHHVPHYRRMWLLLSTAGRVSTAYGSFEGFKNYWRDRLNTLRGDRAGAWTPLVFEVVNFKADKSQGKSVIDADFTLKVSVRGQRKDGPIQSIPMHIDLVRGPDKMWYLETGTIARPRSHDPAPPASERE